MTDTDEIRYVLLKPAIAAVFIVIVKTRPDILAATAPYPVSLS